MRLAPLEIYSILFLESPEALRGQPVDSRVAQFDRIASVIFIPLTLVTVLFVAHISLGVRLKGVMGVIYMGMGFYWLMAFSIRPWYWVIETPNSFALLGDSRLANSDYGQPLFEILWLIALGESIFLAISLYAFRARILEGWKKEKFTNLLAPLTSQRFLTTITIFYIFGWLGRFALLNEIPFIGTALTPFAIVAAATLIIFSKFWNSRFLPAQIAVLVSLEFLWAFSLGSKASAFVPLVALACRWNIIPNRGKGSWRVLPLLPLVAAIAFQTLQTQRGILNEEVSMARSGDGSNPFRGFFISVLERFDGAAAIVDAYAAQSISKWISVSEYFERATLNLFPRAPFSPVVENGGQQWTREVVSQSKFYQYQDVSLASGFWAEGLALAGVGGMVLLAILQALLVTKLVSKVETGNVYWYLLFCFTIFSPALWEQGLIGGTAALGKGVQILVVYFFVQAIVGIIYDAKDKSPESQLSSRSLSPKTSKDKRRTI